MNLALVNTCFSGLCLFSLALLILLTFQNNNKQAELRQHQLTINKGKLTQQVATQIVKDMALLSVQDEEIKALLEEHGFSVSVDSPQESAP